MKGCCSVKKTKEGVQVEVKSKDPKKAESALKALAKACKSFCGCCK
ncbi:MAG: hypothetical protein M0R35_05435 [Candidatus Omnitrophica bacterium]|nr:hypothetical protein [Candidatus Omnitrophota bacterium]